mgnify:CR=1 FL=1
MSMTTKCVYNIDEFYQLSQYEQQAALTDLQRNKDFYNFSDTSIHRYLRITYYFLNPNSYVWVNSELSTHITYSQLKTLLLLVKD